ncbi:hypothetical protein BK399_26845, partial [Escherichia coli]|uniref:hypothetical protein n=1 Tax=Escherichia coli TaxID=562 RepID=UPI00092A3A32
VLKKDQRIFLRSFFSARNLLPVNEKTAAGDGGLFAGIKSVGELFFPKVTGLVERRYQILSF